ncbi:hypothetical protein ACQ27_gp677 [Klebsiella phage K64-1]|nr:hypothetical protein ACQ27_gp677 [Klebsiella phage K64-1]
MHCISCINSIKFIISTDIRIANKNI